MQPCPGRVRGRGPECHTEIGTSACACGHWRCATAVYHAPFAAAGGDGCSTSVLACSASSAQRHRHLSTLDTHFHAPAASDTRWPAATHVLTWRMGCKQSEHHTISSSGCKLHTQHVVTVVVLTAAKRTNKQLEWRQCSSCRLQFAAKTNAQVCRLVRGGTTRWCVQATWCMYAQMRTLEPAVLPINTRSPAASAANVNQHPPAPSSMNRCCCRAAPRSRAPSSPCACLLSGAAAHLLLPPMTSGARPATDCREMSSVSAGRWITKAWHWP